MPALKRARFLIAAAALAGVIPLLPAAYAEPSPTTPIEGYVRDPQLSEGYSSEVCIGTRPGTEAARDMFVSQFQLSTTYTYACREVDKGSAPCDGEWSPSYSTCWSNHANGRGLDLMVYSDTAKGNQIVDWILATDSAGNKHARARRLGIQEILWNNRCWQNNRTDDRAVYLATQMRSCGVGHYDHPHLSFNLAGAQKQTSWWTSTAAPGNTYDMLVEPGAPTIAAMSSSRVDVFVTGADGKLLQKYNPAPGSGGWTGWIAQGGANNSAPDAAAPYDRRLDAFARGTKTGCATNQLMHRYFANETWSDWVCAGGTLTSAPSVVAQKDATNRYDVFYRGGDGRLFQSYRSATSGWVSPGAVGPAITSAPDAASQKPNSYDVFYRNSTGKLGQSYWRGSSWAHTSITSGTLASAPAAVSSADGRLDVFVIETDGNLYQYYWRNTGTWSKVLRLNGATGGVDVTARPNGYLDVVTRNADGDYVHNSWNGVNWIGWQPIE